MIVPARSLLAAAAVLAMLGGCQKKAAEREQAAGEVLEGTVSDAMIKTDEVRVEVPTAPRASATASGKAAKGAKSDKATRADADTAANEAAPEPEVAAPAPAAVPAPAPKGT